MCVYLIAGKAIGLPEDFLSSGAGGGVIQGSASECMLVSLLAARAHTIRRLRSQDGSEAKAPELLDNDAAGEETAKDSAYLPRLVAYCSRESHSCVEKAARMALVRLRILEPDEHSSLRGHTLAKVSACETEGRQPRTAEVRCLSAYLQAVADEWFALRCGSTSHTCCLWARRPWRRTRSAAWCPSSSPPRWGPPRAAHSTT